MKFRNITVVIECVYGVVEDTLTLVVAERIPIALAQCKVD